MDVPRAAVVNMLIPTFVPFNLVKGGLNMGLTLLLYKPIISAMRRAHLVPPSKQKQQKSLMSQLGMPILSVVLLATFVVLFLILAKVI
jgi:hypothetical protein